MPTDPDSYFDTPARIIAEDQTFIVVALRLEKSWLKQNLPILAALSDVTGDDIQQRVTG